MYLPTCLCTGGKFPFRTRLAPLEYHIRTLYTLSHSRSYKGSTVRGDQVGEGNNNFTARRVTHPRRRHSSRINWHVNTELLLLLSSSSSSSSRTTVVNNNNNNIIQTKRIFGETNSLWKNT